MHDQKTITLIASLSGSGKVNVASVEAHSTSIILVDLLVITLLSVVLLSILIRLIIS